ncbi:hypothetical protein Tco_0432578 [Tanacetum coccineum]
MTAEHSSLSFTDEAAFYSFSLCDRRSLRTIAPFGMWIMASRKGRRCLGFVTRIDKGFFAPNFIITGLFVRERRRMRGGTQVRRIHEIMGHPTGLPGIERIPQYDPIPRLRGARNRRICDQLNAVRSRGKNLFRKLEDSCSHEVAWMGDSLSSHFFASLFRGFSVSNLWNSHTLWISQMSWASNTSPVCSSGKVIEFWNPAWFGRECSCKVLGTGVMAGFAFTDDDTPSLKRFRPAMFKDSLGGCRRATFLRRCISHSGYLDTRKSTSGEIQLLGGDKLVSWSSKKQDCTSMSTVEVEYVSLSVCCAQVLWMRTQLTDYDFHFDKIPIYCDSKAAIAISCNSVQHSRTKHIDVRYHFIKEQVKRGIVELFFIKTEYQLADLFIKALSEDRFKYLVRRLDMRCLTLAELEVLTNESA